MVKNYFASLEQSYSETAWQTKDRLVRALFG